jgi:hypothetical protein
MTFFDIFAVVEMGFISYIPASLFRHSLYLPHRERTTKEEREGRQTLLLCLLVRRGANSDSSEKQGIGQKEQRKTASMMTKRRKDV